jgi:glycosyltransferase involved in cell wall biosynthesis
MGMKPGVPDPRGVHRVARHLRRFRPAVVQTWMDHSNLIGGLATRIASPAHVVWGIHHSNHVPGLTKRMTQMTVSACAMLSHRIPSKIVCCSEYARTLYARRGFADERVVVIPNGFDTNAFRPDPEARAAIRREIGLDDSVPLVGLIGRYNPFKDHATFLRAAALLKSRLPAVQFLLCGADVDAGNAELMRQINEQGLVNSSHLLGPRRDVPRIFAAIDVLASSSVSEAFPLVLGEAMACGVPCAATDVGDSALIVGGTGRIVPPSDPAALAGAVAELLNLPAADRARLVRAGRERIQEKFDLGAITRRYEALYVDLVSNGRPVNGRSSRVVARASMNVS